MHRWAKEELVLCCGNSHNKSIRSYIHSFDQVYEISIWL